MAALIEQHRRKEGCLKIIELNRGHKRGVFVSQNIDCKRLWRPRESRLYRRGVGEAQRYFRRKVPKCKGWKVSWSKAIKLRKLLRDGNSKLRSRWWKKIILNTDWGRSGKSIADNYKEETKRVGTFFEVSLKFKCPCYQRHLPTLSAARVEWALDMLRVRFSVKNFQIMVVESILLWKLLSCFDNFCKYPRADLLGSRAYLLLSCANVLSSFY